MDMGIPQSVVSLPSDRIDHATSPARTAQYPMIPIVDCLSQVPSDRSEPLSIMTTANSGMVRKTSCQTSMSIPTSARALTAANAWISMSARVRSGSGAEMGSSAVSDMVVPFGGCGGHSGLDPGATAVEVRQRRLGVPVGGDERDAVEEQDRHEQ